MTLLETLKEAQKDAMRAKDKLRLGTIRMTLAAVKQREIDERIELTEGDVLAIVTKMVKQRKDAAQQFADAGHVNPALESKPEMVGPQPKVSDTFPNDSSLSNSANIKLDDSTIPGPQVEGYPTTSPANLPKPEEPGTFLGLEGKDYTKMGMQGALAAGVGMASQPPVQPSKAPAGPGMTKGNPIPMPQGGMQGVNSMVKPDPRVNSMQMTQAQGLLNPFQRDRYRRGQY